ncbi:MAG: hypothetical protein GX032_04190 [Tenericutes bacterium]|nr:hypothetical protein [Mycoplasmatota bacterium]
MAKKKLGIGSIEVNKKFKDSELALLEVEPTEENVELSFPEELKILNEVTNDNNYQNIRINKDINKQLKK